MKTKIYYYLIGALVLGIVAVLAFQNKPIQTQDTNTQVMVDTGTVITTGIIDTGSLLTGTQENSLIYTNTEYGFQLTLPEGWKEYKEFVYRNFEGWNGIIAGIDIVLPTNSSWSGIQDPNDKNKTISGYAAMFRVYVRTYQGYQVLFEQCGKDPTPVCLMINDILGKGKYIYTIYGPQDLPTDLYKNPGFGNYFNDIKNGFMVLN